MNGFNSHTDQSNAIPKNINWLPAGQPALLISCHVRVDQGLMTRLLEEKIPMDQLV